MPSAIAAHPVHANVAFVRIPEFDARTVTEQAALKDRLESRVRKAIDGLAPADRLVLDSHDGIALVLFGDSARALRIAQLLRGEEAFAQVGLNHGPLALTTSGTEARVFGDGLAAAEAAARFATPERVLVTQDFLRALDSWAPESAGDFASAGEFTDNRVRQHLLFAADPQLRAARRRRAWATGIGGVTAILLLGIFARLASQIFFPAAPALITFAVKPRAEVFVDGVSHGRTPPLRQVEVPAGKHVIVLRNPGSPPLEMNVDVKAGQQLTVSHTFAAPRRPEPKREPDFWRDLKKKFGGS
jgi:hypothetical protein